MRVKNCLLILFFCVHGLSLFPQDSARTFEQNEKDSIANDSRRQYEERLKFLEEIRRRREKDPIRFDDSVSRIKELSRYEEATQRIEKYKLSDISTLKEIDLTGARLEKVPEWIYSAHKLEVFILDHNKISKLPKRLKELPNLKRIYWRFNDLSKSKVKISKLPKVEKLDLTGNGLSKLPRLHHLNELNELVLEDNQFTKLPTWKGRRLKNLEELDVSKNPLKLDKRWYGLIDHVEILRLNKCQIDEIHPTLYKMSGLKQLLIQVNELEEIPEGISSLKFLNKLSFYKNSISTLPPDLFELRGLQVIDLYYNELEFLPPAISNLENLEILYLSFNKLYDIPAEIGELANLKELYIHHNRLSQIPSEYAQLKKLEVFHIQDNYIPAFPNQVFKMTSLIDLDISDTEIKSIPMELTDLKLKNFYWRNLDINLNDIRQIETRRTLVELMKNKTNIVPRISIRETTN
ncbi:leucine-rich repeat domain-containing protein [Ekhidna sp.]|uniref:leucine-rich repeat domain-containing protein n=1 Tax=Ekhidna sp. TaxID=2608089 RepID=UPI003BACB38C